MAKVADAIRPALTLVVTGKTNGTWMVTELVANAHDLKLGVHPYTFRADALPDFDASREELRSLFLVQVGVHGLFTDHPDRVAAFLRAQAN